MKIVLDEKESTSSSSGTGIDGNGETVGSHVTTIVQESQGQESGMEFWSRENILTVNELPRGTHEGNPLVVVGTKFHYECKIQFAESIYSADKAWDLFKEKVEADKTVTIDLLSGGTISHS